MNNKINRNIFIGYIFNFLMYFRITNAIWVIYLSTKGFSLAQIGLLESVFHVTSFLCEVPTGAIADMYGRKFSVILGRVSSIVSTILMITSTNIFGFAAAFVFNGLSYTLNSGSCDALVYDSLKEMGKESLYKKICGSISAIIEVSGSIAVILGGILSDMRYLYAYIALIIVDTIAIIAAANFYEPRELNKVSVEKTRFLIQIKESFKTLFSLRVVFYLIVFFEFTSTISTTVYFYCQKYFQLMHYSKTQIAIIFTIDGIICAVSAKFAYRIEQRINQRGIIILLPFVNSAALLGLSFTSGIAAVLFFFFTSFTNGIGYPVFSDYINSLIPSEFRATILSAQSCCFSIFMIVLFPLVGVLSGHLGLSYSFVVLGIVFIPGIIFISMKLRKANAR